MSAEENKELSIKQVAYGYWKQGCNIVLLKEKKPLHTWAQWQTQKQTREEFNALPWRNADGFGVICGTQGANGLFFVAIDVDKPDFNIDLLRTTQMERTPRGGYHFYYWSRTPVKGRKEHALGVELLGRGNYVRVYPAKRLNDNQPTKVENVDELFGTLVASLGGRPGRKSVDIKRLLGGVREGERDDSAIQLASYYRKKGLGQEQVLAKLLEWNKKNAPPLGQEVIRAKVESAFAPNEPYSYHFDAEDFNPVEFAEHLLRTYHFRTTRDNETVYVYDSSKGLYTTDGESFIKEQMAQTLGLETRQRYYPDVIFYIKAKTYFDRQNTADTGLAVLNGILDVVNRELRPFTPERFITVQVPVTYDPDAECPAIMRFLNEVVGEEQASLIQEFAGYCLYQAMPIHKAIMFVGDGANGKSTLLRLLRAFLGATNVSNVSLQALCGNRFAAAHLWGKLANFCSDIPSQSLTHTGMFKMLTGNDAIMFEEKFKSGFMGVNTAKLGFSCNRIPETEDDTTAFFRRWIISTFNNVFTGSKCDKNILDKLTTPNELSGFLNYALDGLKRLLTNGSFSEIDDLEKLRSNYIRKSNSAKAFIEEQLVYNPDPDPPIPKAELYERYVRYCQKNSLPSMKKGQFTQNVNQFLPQAKETTSRIEGKSGIHVWQHIGYAVASVATTLLDHKNNDNSVSKSNIDLTDFPRVNREVATSATVATKVDYPSFPEDG